MLADKHTPAPPASPAPLEYRAQDEWGIAPESVFPQFFAGVGLLIGALLVSMMLPILLPLALAGAIWYANHLRKSKGWTIVLPIFLGTMLSGCLLIGMCAAVLGGMVWFGSR